MDSSIKESKFLFGSLPSPSPPSYLTLPWQAEWPSTRLNIAGPNKGGASSGFRGIPSKRRLSTTLYAPLWENRRRKMERRKKATIEQPARRRERERERDGEVGFKTHGFKKGIAIANNIDGSRGIRREALVCVASRP